MMQPVKSVDNVCANCMVNYLKYCNTKKHFFRKLKMDGNIYCKLTY